MRWTEPWKNLAKFIFIPNPSPKTMEKSWGRIWALALPRGKLGIYALTKISCDSMVFSHYFCLHGPVGRHISVTQNTRQMIPPPPSILTPHMKKVPFWSICPCNAESLSDDLGAFFSIWSWEEEAKNNLMIYLDVALVPWNGKKKVSAVMSSFPAFFISQDILMVWFEEPTSPDNHISSLKIARGSLGTDLDTRPSLAKKKSRQMKYFDKEASQFDSNSEALFLLLLRSKKVFSFLTCHFFESVIYSWQMAESSNFRLSVRIIFSVFLSLPSQDRKSKPTWHISFGHWTPAIFLWLWEKWRDFSGAPSYIQISNKRAEVNMPESFYAFSFH